MMAVFVLFSIFGCASTKQIENSTVAPVYITNTKKFYLMSPAEIENKIDIIPNVDRATSSPLFKSLSFSKNATKTIKIEKNTSQV